MKLIDFARVALKTIGEVVYGMALHDHVRSQLREVHSRNHLFMLITFGDLVGIPVLPPYYTLNLLPFIVPEINTWRRYVLRERDLLDIIA